MLTEKRWSADSQLRLLLRLLVLLGVAGLAAAAADRLWPDSDPETRRFWSSTVSGVLVQLGGVLLIARFLRENRISWGEAFGLRWAGAGVQVLRGLGMALGVFGAALALMLASQWLLQLLHLPARPQAAIEALQNSPDPPRRAAVALTAVLLAPVFEELIFRGLLLPALRQAGYPRLAFWGTAVFFACTHLNLLTFLPLVFFALMLNLLYLRTGSLVGPITAHAAFNAVNYTWVVLGGPGS